MISWLLVLVMTAALAVGGTLAYLMDTDEDVNVMTVGKVKIEQLEYERTDVEDKDADAKLQEFHDNKPLYPAVTNGDWNTDDAWVDFNQIGKNDQGGIWDSETINNEQDKMVFVKNKGDWDAYVRTVFAFEAGNYATLDEYLGSMHLNLNDTDWTWEWNDTAVQIGEAKYFIAIATYNKALKPGELTEVSLLQVALDSTANNEDVEGFGETYQILVKSQAVQADGFDSPKQALKEAFGDVPPAPFDDDNPIIGTDVKTALHYLNGNRNGTVLTDTVTNVVFGNAADYPAIVDAYEGTLVDVEQDVDVNAYYVDDGSSYTVYFLANDEIYMPKDSTELFYSMDALQTVDTANLNTSRTEIMDSLFYDCKKLTSVTGTGSWDTSNVKSMVDAFHSCEVLPKLDVSGWNVRNVESMLRTFHSCLAITEFTGIENWRMTSNKDAWSMFESCKALETLNATDWDMGQVETMRGMFYNCPNLKGVEGIGTWDTGSLQVTWDMFAYCTVLETLEGLENWNMSNATNLCGMFHHCPTLQDDDVEAIEGWDVSNAEDISWLFKGDTGLVSIDLSQWDVSNVKKFNSMFSAQKQNSGEMNLISFGIENWDTSSATHMGWMFFGCGKMTSIDLSNWNVDNLIHVGHMFADCFKVESINFDGWTAPNLQTIDAMFNDCRALKVVDMSDFTMESCVEFSQTFEACWSLERVIGMENWDTSKGYTFVEMFNGCSSLKELNWSNVDTGAAYDRYVDMNNSYSNAFKPTFNNVNSLEKLIVGAKVGYYGNTNVPDDNKVSEANRLVFPNPATKEGYIGRWRNVETGVLYASGKDIPEFVAATYVPDYILRGSTMKETLHYLDADPKGTKITAKVSNITFGLRKDYEAIASRYAGAVVNGGEQDVLAYAYYVPNGSNYDIYVLSEVPIYAPVNAKDLFRGMTALKTVNGSNLDTSRTTNMDYMFRDCTALQSVNNSDWNTSNVTTMSGLFYNCPALTTVDVADWDTSKVTNMSSLFYKCAALTSLDVSNWDTSAVTNMSSLFQGCSALTSLDVPNWNTSKVTNMQNMFNGCSALTSLDVSNWDTSAVMYMTNMFNGCMVINGLDVSDWNTSAVTNMSGTFASCKALTSLDVADWDTSKVTNMSSMFSTCSVLTSLDVSEWDTSKVTNMSSMFASCTVLTNPDVSDWDTSKVTNSMASMFSNCKAITSLDLSGWNTSGVTSMASMFQNCSALTSLNISGWNTSSVTNMSNMFSGCSALTGVDVSGWNTSKVTNMTSMFNACTKVNGLDVSGWNVSEVTNMTSMFANCKALTSLNVANWNTGKVEQMKQMFYNCSSLTSLDVSGWNTGKVKNMYQMLYGCTNLQTIYASNSFTTASVTDSRQMFTNCKALVGGNGTVFNASNITATYAHIDAEGNPGYFTAK